MGRERGTDGHRETQREREPDSYPEASQRWVLAGHQLKAGPGDHQRSVLGPSRGNQEVLAKYPAHLRTIQRNVFHFNILWS